MLTPKQNQTSPNTASPSTKTEQVDQLRRAAAHYLEKKEIDSICRAYTFGAKAHEGQRRRSGEPYISHPLAVARILVDMRLDAATVSAALLHDVIEDTGTLKEQIANEFSPEVAELVDGVSKIDRIQFKTKEDEQAENLRKMLLAVSRDIRVILIKLADRLHNMRTLGSMPRDKQCIIARQTLDIYAPIANRLGVRKWSQELEELSFANMHPKRYTILEGAMRKRHGNRKAIVEKVQAAIENQLKQEELPGEVTGREKNLYSVYRKMVRKRLPFEEVFDMFAFRVTTDKVDTCYRILGAIHNLYKPIPGRFKDYIAIPKANGYQSLHTVVFGPFGVPIEVQIRTEIMHRVAETGVAAHWLHKSANNTQPGVQQRALQWLKDLLENQQKAGNSSEFLEHLKIDLFPDEIYVFTPNGEIKKMPRGATVVDFAYEVHTDVGNRCVSAKINHQLVPLRTRLRNGDHIEVVTADWGRPNPAWLDHVATGKARANIRSFLKNQKFEEAVTLGERLLSQALRDIGASTKIEQSKKAELLQTTKADKWETLLAEIGLGNRMAPMVAKQLTTDANASPAEKNKSALNVRGTEGVVINYARCCRPIPGDAIIGFLSAGRGLVIHTTNCPNIGEFHKHPEKWVDVVWENDIAQEFPVTLRIEAKNRRGVLASVAAAIAEMEANIDAVTFADRDSLYTCMDFTIEVKNRAHLASIMRNIRQQESIVRMFRQKG